VFDPSQFGCNRAGYKCCPIAFGGESCPPDSECCPPRAGDFGGGCAFLPSGEHCCGPNSGGVCEADEDCCPPERTNGDNDGCCLTGVQCCNDVDDCPVGFACSDGCCAP
jgi:hypothetical protein